MARVNPHSAALQALFAEPHHAISDHQAAVLQDKQTHWQTFYLSNGTKFYKDRHWMQREWPCLYTGSINILEVGCGVGNTILPILVRNANARIYACDFSPAAVQLLNDNPKCAASGRVHGFVADLTSTELCQHVPAGSIDYVTMIFVLSAISPDQQPAAIANVVRTLKPGGQVLFRDYASGDEAQGRRESAGGRRLGNRFYVRGDGTCCYHYEPQELAELFNAAGLTCIDMKTHERDIENRKQGVTMHRRWLQATFQLPTHITEVHSSVTAVDANTGHSNSSSADALNVCELTTGNGTTAPHTNRDELRLHSIPATPDKGIYAMTVADDSKAGQGKQVVLGNTPSNVAVTSAAGLLTGTWLAGAAGRLASHAAGLPGVASGRALLPETLDSADELVSTLSPAAHNHRVRHAAYSIDNDTTGSPIRAGNEQLEQDLEKDFFDIINRNTEDVVAEELAAAGLLGITFNDPLRPDTVSASTGKQAKHAAQPSNATHAHGSSMTKKKSANASQAPAGKQQHETGGETAANVHNTCVSATCKGGNNSRQRAADQNITDTLAQRPTIQSVDVIPGISFSSWGPYPSGMQGVSQSTGQAFPWHDGHSLQQQGSYNVAHRKECVLARLLAVCSRQPSSLMSRSIRGGHVLQLAAGPTALAGMVAVKYCGARRVLLTHPDRRCLNAAAANVLLNAHNVVIERLKLAQLDMAHNKTVSNVAEQLQSGRGSRVILAADLLTAAIGLQEAVTNETSPRQLTTKTHELQTLLTFCHYLAAPARTLTVDAPISQLQQPNVGGCSIFFVALVHEQEIAFMTTIAEQCGWTVHHECSHELRHAFNALNQQYSIGNGLQNLLPSVLVPG